MSVFPSHRDTLTIFLNRVSSKNVASHVDLVRPPDYPRPTARLLANTPAPSVAEAEGRPAHRHPVAVHGHAPRALAKREESKNNGEEGGTRNWEMCTTESSYFSM